MESPDASDHDKSKNSVGVNPLYSETLNNQIMENKKYEAVTELMEESEVQIDLLGKSRKLQRDYG